MNNPAPAPGQPGYDPDYQGLEGLIRGIIGRKSLALMDQLGGPVRMNTAVARARGEGEGPIDPRVAGMPNEDLAEEDRFSQFANFAQEVPSYAHHLVGPVVLATAAGNEAAKGLGLGGMLAKMLGEKQFEDDGTTSPASWRNIGGAARGYLAGALRY